MTELNDFNRWVDDILIEMANNESVSLLEFHLFFNRVEAERQIVIELMGKIDNLLNDDEFS